jgi:hypothetical protein
MRGLVPRIHAFRARGKDVDGRDEPGHDGVAGINGAWPGNVQ